MTSTKRSYIKTNRAAQAGELVGVRLQPEQMARIDAWRADQPGLMSRPEAIRALVDQALSAPERAASLIDLADLIFTDGLDRTPSPHMPSEGVQTSQVLVDEPWPEDLRDSFIVAPEPVTISRSHEIKAPPKPLPEPPLDSLGPLGPLDIPPRPNSKG